MDWGVILGSGGILATMLKTFVDVAKSKDAAKKINVDAAKVLTDIAVGMTKELENDVKELGTKYEDLRQSAWRTEALLREHSKWDHKAASELRNLGLDIGNPPPLYEAQTGTQGR